jgi:hypothetical protein
VYTASITSASLRVRESRVIAELLLQEVDAKAWREAIKEQNVLQMKSVKAASSIAKLIRARLEPMGPGLWEMVRDSDRELATQAVFAAAVGNSRLLGDFLDLVIRDHLAVFNRVLEPHVWANYIGACHGRDPDMPAWSEATVTKLRSTVYTMLSEVGFLQDTKTLHIQNVFVEPSLAVYLRDRGESYVLRCLEVTQ